MHLPDREGIKCSSGFTTGILLKPRTKCEAAWKIPAGKDWNECNPPRGWGNNLPFLWRGHSQPSLPCWMKYWWLRRLKSDVLWEYLRASTASKLVVPSTMRIHSLMPCSPKISQWCSSWNHPQPREDWRNNEEIKCQPLLDLFADCQSLWDEGSILWSGLVHSS